MSLIDQFTSFYRSVSHETLNVLDEIYADDAVLRDPITEHRGLSNIRDYFASLLARTKRCDCNIEHVSDGGNEVYVTWEMIIEHPSLNRGQAFSVNGITYLKTNPDKTKVLYHRDYYDLGEMVYERVPVLNYVIKGIKKRMGE